MKYVVVLEAWISIMDTITMVTWADQGWYFYKNDEFHSLMVCVRKDITIESFDIQSYVDAVNTIGGDIGVAYYYEADEKN